MGEIKSAWQIAMERAEKLGRLSPEELKKQKEESVKKTIDEAVKFAEESPYPAPEECLTDVYVSYP